MLSLVTSDRLDTVAAPGNLALERGNLPPIMNTGTAGVSNRRSVAMRVHGGTAKPIANVPLSTRL